MSLTIKTGGKESDSFVTVSEADTILATIFSDTELSSWGDLNDGEKEYRLRLAAQAMVTLPLKGRRVFCGQNLTFPRDVQENVHSIPTEVKEVQAFVAFNVIHKGLVNRPLPAESESGARVSSVSLGGLLSVSFSGKAVETGAGLDKIIRSSQFPAYLTMSKYLTNFRGGAVPNEDELDECMTTTTTT